MRFARGQILPFQPNATYAGMSEVSAFDLVPVVRNGKRQVISVRFKLIGEWKGGGEGHAKKLSQGGIMSFMSESFPLYENASTTRGLS